MLQHSEQINEISAAVSAAQGEIENANKNAANPHFKSKYADLAEVLNVIRPVFSKNNLAITQHPAYTDGVCYVTTLLSHSSGQWMKSCASSPIGKADAQGVGSCLTYLRRYSLAAICGIAQEDDDGNGASGKKKDDKGRKEAAPPSELDPAIIEKLQAAKDMKDLAAAWSSIDVGIRHDYSGIKDECKAKLGGK